MIKLRRVIYAIFAASLVLALSGCKMVILQPKGAVALEEKHLMITAVLLMLLIVIPVLFLVLFIARRYRASNTKAKYTPEWSHSTLLEFVWWMIPIVIIAILATITWITTHQLDPYKALDKGGKPMTIQAVALRWRWLFIYPKQHIATIDYVQFPVDKQVRFEITSDAPMNSFQIPALAGQIYAMNGMTTQLHMISHYPGVYNGRSVSFSGNGFSNMKFKAHVTSEKQFNSWVSSVKKGHQSLTWAQYQTLSQPSKSSSPMFFSTVDKGLFEKVIHKFMPADKHSVDTKYTAVHL